MKKLLFAFLLLPVMLMAQSKGFTLSGNVTGISDGTIKITPTNDPERTLFSGPIKAGAFTVKGAVPEPGLYWLVIEKEQPQYIFLENSTIKITGTKKDIKKLKVEGSSSHRDFTEFQSVFNPLFADLSVAVNNVQREGNAEKKPMLMARYDSLVKVTHATVKSFLSTKKNSFISPVVIFATAPVINDPFKLEEFYNSLDEPIRASNMGRALQNEIANAKFGAVGTEAVDFTQNDTSGKAIALSSFKGKYVLLDFWASWCRPCRMENPNVVKVFNKFKSKNFTVLGISLDQQKDAWVKAIEKDNLTWTHVSDLKYWSNEVAQMYRVQSIPQNYLLDPSGKIVGKDLHGEALEKKLCELLGCN